MSFGKLRVLVIDDSAFNRRAIVKMLESVPNVEVIGYACDGEEGLRKVIDLKPDLVTLDLEMPRMDGFTLLRIVMQNQPTPIIVVSSVSGDENVFKALELGAVEFVSKPTARVSPALMDIRDELIEKVREVTGANLNNVIARSSGGESARSRGVPTPKVRPADMAGCDFPVVAIASSTGGPPALQTIFSAIQDEIPLAFVVAQHMPANFTRAFAERLNRFSALTIHEAAEGDVLKPGHVLIAPGGKNLGFHEKDGELVVELGQPKPHHRYVPSADVLFSSLAPICGKRLVGVVLTGMGNDGSRGAMIIKQHQGLVLAEAEETSVVFGMPKETISAVTVDGVVPLPQMCREIFRVCKVLP
ncbi:MAG TPA: chemotaxis response regulator protein-glutamate methylesterase [Desulfuromonadales bacterium]|nr:chemotaxis response regulator protein-glutamate methylesterase [Desulfuromonadales bacterium]